MKVYFTVFSERKLTFTFAMSPVRRLSNCLSVCLSSVCTAHAPYSGG